jgi:activator of 2-hydroxyglutaryl-CoA dehydratase
LACTSRSPHAPQACCAEEDVTFTGGVARNLAMIETLNERLGVEVNVSEESHFMGALGAALFALDHILASRAPAKSGRDRV